jgi:LysR family glycine cleavage system transcriptional activator
MQAAVGGLGVAILPEVLVQQEIAAGELIQPFAYPVRSAHAYHLVYPEEKRELPTLKAFRDWLLEQMATENN